MNYALRHGFACAVCSNGTCLVARPPARPPARLPSWALSRGHDISEADAAFAAGIALKSLDDLIRADPLWLGCWRERLALKSAAVAARMIGRSEGETPVVTPFC